MTLKADEVNGWSELQVQEWLRDEGYRADVVDTFHRNAVDGYTLVRITEENLR